MKHLHPQEQFIQDRDIELQEELSQDRKNDYLLKAYSKDRLEPNEESEIKQHIGYKPMDLKTTKVV